MKLGRDIVRLNLVRILLVTILETVSAGDSVLVSPPDCKALPRSGVSDITHKRRHTGYRPDVSCTQLDKQVTVRVTYHVTHHTASVSVWACPSVERVQVQLNEVKGHFLHWPRGVTVSSCVTANDTAFFAKGHSRKHVTLGFSPTGYLTHSLRLNYSYSYHTDERPKDGEENFYTTTSPSLPNASAEEYDVTALVQQRHPRSLSVDTQVEHNSTTDYQTGSVWPTTGCGKTQTCIRFGREGCGHLECDYLLTYRVINMTLADIQLSARTTGWVAVGFSSDRHMGSDDVVGCKRDVLQSDKVVSISLWTEGNFRPKSKENHLTMLAGRVQDGHIYCRLQRPLKYEDGPSGQDLDLSNDWHQLYAFGDVDGNGQMLQHKTSHASEESITMMKTHNFLGLWDTASPPVAEASVWPATGCGNTQTCIRFGNDGCDHLECDYLLTYRVINMTLADIQLSARTTGWVAVGFSSDRYMGGGDDVVACKRDVIQSNKIVSMSMYNQGRSRPKTKDNPLTMLDGRMQDGHIYCRLQRPLKYKNSHDDHDLDLSNDWHQLYAFGDVDGKSLMGHANSVETHLSLQEALGPPVGPNNGTAHECLRASDDGLMLQHKTSHASQQKITMIRTHNFLRPWNAASLPVASYVIIPALIASLTLSLAGS